MSGSLVRKLPVAPALLTDGDEIERSTWEEMKSYVPHYEEFWAIYVYPLRAGGSIYFRQGIDTEFEWLASLNYSMYVALSRGYGKIVGRSEDFKFFEEIYSDLYRAVEVAQKVIKKFRGIHQKCLNSEPEVSTTSLNQVEEDLRVYRNLLHDGILATVKDDQQRLIPKRTCLERYDLWSKVRQAHHREDFVTVDTQLWDDFRALCSGIEDSWKQMVACRTALQANAKYRQRIAQGIDSPSLAVPISASGNIIARSDQW